MQEKKVINIYETFAGIGSQLKSLNNIAKKLNVKINSLGIVEWYIDAIVSYEIIHKGLLKKETKLSKEQMVNILGGGVYIHSLLIVNLLLHLIIF